MASARRISIYLALVFLLSSCMTLSIAKNIFGENRTTIFDNFDIFKERLEAASADDDSLYAFLSGIDLFRYTGDCRSLTRYDGYSEYCLVCDHDYVADAGPFDYLFSNQNKKTFKVYDYNLPAIVLDNAVRLMESNGDDRKYGQLVESIQKYFESVQKNVETILKHCFGENRTTIFDNFDIFKERLEAASADDDSLYAFLSGIDLFRYTGDCRSLICYGDYSEYCSALEEVYKAPSYLFVRTFGDAGDYKAFKVYDYNLPAIVLADTIRLMKTHEGDGKYGQLGETVLKKIGSLNERELRKIRSNPNAFLRSASDILLLIRSNILKTGDWSGFVKTWVSVKDIVGFNENTCAELFNTLIPAIDSMDDRAFYNLCEIFVNIGAGIETHYLTDGVKTALSDSAIARYEKNKNSVSVRDAMALLMSCFPFRNKLLGRRPDLWSFMKEYALSVGTAVAYYDAYVSLLLEKNPKKHAEAIGFLRKAYDLEPLDEKISEAFERVTRILEYERKYKDDTATYSETALLAAEYDCGGYVVQNKAKAVEIFKSISGRGPSGASVYIDWGMLYLSKAYWFGEGGLKANPDESVRLMKHAMASAWTSKEAQLLFRTLNIHVSKPKTLDYGLLGEDLSAYLLYRVSRFVNSPEPEKWEANWWSYIVPGLRFYRDPSWYWTSGGDGSSENLGCYGYTPHAFVWSVHEVNLFSEAFPLIWVYVNAPAYLAN